MEINCPSCNEGILIADEDMAKTFKCPFCQQSIAFDKPEPPPVEKPPIIQPQSSTGERIYLEGEGLKVTDKRVIMRNRTYACKQITSVGVTHDFLGQKLLFGKSVVAVGFLSWIPAAFTFVLMWALLNTSASSWKSLAVILFGVSILVGLIITIMCWSQSGQPRYWIEIATSSGREQAMLCVSEESAQQICEAINAAIIDN